MPGLYARSGREFPYTTDTCSLGFSEKNITYRSKDLQAAYRADGPQVPAQCKEFNKAASALISDVARKAVDARYASGEEDLDEHGCTYKLYGFAECSPQIPAAQCQLCLEDLTAVPGLSGHVGERKATLWCTYRFEPYLFFKTSKGGHRTLWIVLGVVGGAVIIALIALIFLLWWRMPERKLVKDLVNRALTSFSDLKVTHGKKVLEVRPKADFNKGHAVNYLLECLVNKNNWDSTQVLAIYIGDDRTDEDAFKVLSGHGGFGILVSKKRRSTDALYSLRNPRQVKEFLQKLVTWNNGEAQV